MSIAHRDGGPGDGKAVADLFRESFIATFGHLYAAEDLNAFLGGLTTEAFEEELASAAAPPAASDDMDELPPLLCRVALEERDPNHGRQLLAHLGCLRCPASALEGDPDDRGVGVGQQDQATRAVSHRPK